MKKAESLGIEHGRPFTSSYKEPCGIRVHSPIWGRDMILRLCISISISIENRNWVRLPSGQLNADRSRGTKDLRDIIRVVIVPLVTVSCGARPN